MKTLSTAFLAKLIPWLLLGIFIYLALKPSLGTRERRPRLSAAAFWPLAGLLIGFYDGFLGPGTGTFWTIAIVLLLGADFLAATAQTKLMNATSNVASLAIFACAGQVDYVAGGTMAIGQLIGARIGTRLVLTRGAKLVRPLFLFVVGATILRLLYVSWMK